MRKNLLFILLAALGCNMAWAQTPAYIPAGGLLFYEGFDNGVSQNGLSEYLIPQTTYGLDPHGDTLGAYLFEGAGNIYDNNTIDMSGNGFTSAAYFKFDGYNSYTWAGNYTPHIMNLRVGACNTAPCSPLNIYVDYNGGATGTLYASMALTIGGTSQQIIVGGTASVIDTATWTHLAVVLNQSAQTLSMYIDGALVQSVSTGAYTPFTNTGQGFRIGSLEGTLNRQSWNGGLDDLALWNRSLSATEVANIYNEVAACDPPQILAQNWPSDTITICSHCDNFAATCNTNISVNTTTLPNTTYAWYNASGLVQSGTSLNLRPWSGYPAGKYWVVGSNSCGTVTSDTVYLNYYEPFQLTLVQNGTALQANTSSASGNQTYSYEWYDANLNLLSTTTTNSYTPATAGTYFLKVINQYGCSRVDDLNYNPTACTNPAYNGLTGASTLAGITIADTITVCFGSDIAVWANFNNATTFDWFRNGVSLNRNQNDLAYSSALDGTYYATATNSCGTTVSDTFVIRTSANYLIYASQVGSQVELAFVPALPAGATATAVWYDNNNNQVSTSIPFTPLADGLYNAQVTVTYDNSYNYTFSSCTFTSSYVQYVAPVSCPNPPMLNPASVDICQGDSYNFDGQVLTQAGTYFATFTDANGCDSLVELTLSVFDAPATPTIVANGDTLSVETTDTVALDYAWYLDGDLISGETAATLVATANGDYTVEVTLGNCAATSVALTYTGVGIAENNLTQNVSVYPNPTKGLLQVSVAGATVLTYQVYGATGQLVANGLADGNTTINLTNHAAGIYLLHLADANGNVTTKRFVKE